MKVAGYSVKDQCFKCTPLYCISVLSFSVSVALFCNNDLVGWQNQLINWSECLNHWEVWLQWASWLAPWDSRTFVNTFSLCRPFHGLFSLLDLSYQLNMITSLSLCFLLLFFTIAKFSDINNSSRFILIIGKKTWVPQCAEKNLWPVNLLNFKKYKVVKIRTRLYF